MSKGKQSVPFALSLGLLWFRATDALAQCAMCGTALSSPDDPLVRGIGWSTVFLIAVPFTLVGSVGAWLYWAHRRAFPPGPGARLPAISKGPGREGSVATKEVCK